MTNFGVVVVLLQGAIVVWNGWGAEGNDQFWGSVVVPLQGGVDCSIVWFGGEGDNQFW